MSLVVESTLGGVKLEGPEEIVSFLEVRTAGFNFVDQIFNGNDVELAQSISDDFIGGKGNSLLVDLTESSLVDQVRNSLSSGITEGNIRLDLLEHVQGSSVDSDKGSVVDLSESEQL